jgi:hypothetical protein
VKYLIPLAFALTATAAEARSWQNDYPSCNVTQQRHLNGSSGKTAMQDHISMRANILQADIGTASKARPITRRQSQRLWSRVDAVRKASHRLAIKQGFLSAAERASYDRQLDVIALQLCK